MGEGWLPGGPRGGGPRVQEGSLPLSFLQHLPSTFQLVKTLRFTPSCTPDNGHYVVWPHLPANPAPLAPLALPALPPGRRPQSPRRGGQEKEPWERQLRDRPQ